MRRGWYANLLVDSWFLQSPDKWVKVMRHNKVVRMAESW